MDPLDAHLARYRPPRNAPDWTRRAVLRTLVAGITANIPTTKIRGYIIRNGGDNVPHVTSPTQWATLVQQARHRIATTKAGDSQRAVGARSSGGAAARRWRTARHNSVRTAVSLLCADLPVGVRGSPVRRSPHARRLLAMLLCSLLTDVRGWDTLLISCADLGTRLGTTRQAASRALHRLIDVGAVVVVTAPRGGLMRIRLPQRATGGVGAYADRYRTSIDCLAFGVGRDPMGDPLCALLLAAGSPTLSYSGALDTTDWEAAVASEVNVRRVAWLQESRDEYAFNTGSVAAPVTESDRRRIAVNFGLGSAYATGVARWYGTVGGDVAPAELAARLDAIGREHGVPAKVATAWQQREAEKAQRTADVIAARVSRHLASLVDRAGTPALDASNVDRWAWARVAAGWAEKGIIRPAADVPRVWTAIQQLVVDAGWPDLDEHTTRTATIAHGIACTLIAAHARKHGQPDTIIGNDRLTWHQGLAARLVKHDASPEVVDAVARELARVTLWSPRHATT